MRLVVPEYFRDFKCIGGKCEDSCCVGWGIYIDDLTAVKYRSVGGEMGRRLSESIDREEQCFITGDSFRCPFLNGDNLCDIIIRLGEESLCEICDRHPRYFEWFDDVIEGGLGLCCQTAAELVLGAEGFAPVELDAPDKLLCEPDDEPCDGMYYGFLTGARRRIIDLLLDDDVPLQAALGRIAAYAEVLQEFTDIYEIGDVPEIGEESAGFDLLAAAELICRAEPVIGGSEEYWRELRDFVSSCDGACAVRPENQPELRNIAVYFVWRYFMKAVFSGEVFPKLMFAVWGTAVINAMFNMAGMPDFREKCRLAKEFSKLIEYSEDNLRLIMDSFDF